MKTAVLALALVPALATVAHADGASEAKAAERGELSQINGHPIPVGEHNEYFYGYPRVNLSLNPIGIPFGDYSVAGSYAFTDHFVLRAEATYFAPPDSDDTSLELDLTAPIYFRRAYQGAFLEPGIMWRSSEQDGYDEVGNPVRVSTSTFGPEVLLGYHWTWDSGFNVAVAAGAGRNLQPSDDEFADDEIFVNGYVKVGYAF